MSVSCHLLSLFLCSRANQKIFRNGVRITKCKIKPAFGVDLLAVAFPSSALLTIDTNLDLVGTTNFLTIDVLRNT